MENKMKTFREMLVEGNEKFWHVTYRGASEGYIIIKAKNKSDAEKYFNEHKDEFFKNSSSISIDYIDKAEKDEEQYVVNEKTNNKEIYKTIKRILLDSIEYNRIKALSMKDIGVKIIFDDSNKSIKVF